MELKDYAETTKYLNWNESDTYDISLSITFDEFCRLDAIHSDKFDSLQYEIPIFVIKDKTAYESILATKSKVLLSELISLWSENASLILRVSKKGSGFFTKYNVINSKYIYDKASGKIVKLPAK